MHHRARRRVLLTIALLAFLTLEGRASFFQQQSGRQRTLEKEIHYRLTGPADSDWQTAYASSGWVGQDSVAFNPPRGQIHLWARFKAPAVSKPVRYLLHTSPWERVEIFVIRNGRLVDRQLTGTLVPAAERSMHISMTPLFSHSGFVRLELAPDSTTEVLARLVSSQSYGPINWLRVYLWDTAQVLNGERADRIFQGICIGVMLVLLLYNLGLYLYLREISYLYYVLMEVGTMLIWGTLYGLTTEFLWPDKPAWDYYFVWLVFGLTLSFSIQFLRHYLETGRTAPFGDKFLRWLALIGLVSAPFALLVSRSEPRQGLLLLVTPTFITFWAAMFVSISVFRRGHPAARHFLIAITCATAGAMTQFGTLAGVLPINDWTSRASQLGFMAMGVILSFGLGIRLRRIRQDLAEQRIAEAQRQREHEFEKRSLIERQSRELEARVQQRTAELATAREKAEGFLANILPQAIIEELNAKGTIEPRRHEEVSILFTDFSGFTEAVATIPAKRLVQELDEIFRVFDAIAAANGLEKIKTIGDAYMAAAGLPVPTIDHAARCVRTGLALTRFIEERNRTSSLKWNLRVGVHSGAVVAGVVGKNKYAYDVWGDTVNLASRMESASERNRVNISAYTYDLVRDRFDCEYRNKLAVKGKGEIDMYFVLEEKPHPN